jgi:hypothetical protein
MSESPYRQALTNEPSDEEQQLRMLLARDLAPGEELLWMGRPKQGVFLERRDWLQVPFAVAWCGFAIFWEAMAVFGNAPWFFKLWGIPFVCVGLYMVFGRFYYAAWLRARTYYGVTSRRALILTRRSTRELVAFDLSTTNVSMEERDDESGTLTFGIYTPPPPGRWQAVQPPSFVRIPNVRGVMHLIDETRERLRLPP